MVNDRGANTRPKNVSAVVIGGSAGALDALLELLPNLGPRLDVPVVVVVHLPAGRPSLLPELFRERCVVPVHEPNDKDAVGAGSIWVAPPGYHLLIEADRTFSFSVDEPVRFSRPSIDVLFESAADAYGSALVGVVLTGGSDDGARGTRAIRAAGGFVAVQDPRSSDAPHMPRAAIADADPQFVGSLSALSELLRDLTGERA